MNFELLKFLDALNQGRNQDFAKDGGDLKMENFYDVILMTYFRSRNLTSLKWRHNWYS